MDEDDAERQMRMHVRRMLEDAETEARLARLKFEIAVPDFMQDAILQIADPIDAQDSVIRKTDVAEQNFSAINAMYPGLNAKGYRRSSYKNGDVFLNNVVQTGPGFVLRNGRDAQGVKADFLICAEWTDDSHHRFIPVSVNRHDGTLMVHDDIHGYEWLDRPRFTLKPGAMDQLSAARDRPFKFG